MIFMPKKKKHLFLIIGITTAAFAAVALSIYYITNRNTSPLATATFEQIKTESRIPDKEYSNLDFSNTALNIPDTETFYKYYRYYNVVPNTPQQCDEKCRELLNMFFDYIDKEELILADREGVPIGENESAYSDIFTASEVEYIDNNDMMICAVRVDTNGAIQAYDQQVVINVTEGKTEKIIRLDRGEQATDEKYMLNGGEYSPAQALELAYQTIDNVKDYLKSTDLVATNIIIIKNGHDDNYSYRVQFEYQLDNTPFFDSGVRWAVDAEESKYSISHPVLYMTISEPGRVTEIFNMAAYAIEDKEDAYKDKYIPLNTAIEEISKFYAPNYVQKISEISIKYAIVYDYEEIKSYDDEQKIYARPYWCFLIDAEYEPRASCIQEDAILYDMQTGEIILFDPSTHCYISSFD